MLAILIFFRWPVLVTTAMLPQNPQLQQRIEELKEAAAKNKQALAQYRWQQQETVTVKGDVKKQDLFQVELGPDGKPRRTPIAQDDPNTSSSGRQHGITHKLMEKKTKEFDQYAAQIKELAQSYAQPDPERLQEAYKQGNVAIGAGSAPGNVRLVIRDYLKHGDSVTFSVNPSKKELQGIEVSSYLSKPKDAVTMTAEFSRMPDGVNHMSNLVVNGVSKKLMVTLKNFEYHKM
jgi:hypothetical protein